MMNCLNAHLLGYWASLRQVQGSASDVKVVPRYMCLGSFRSEIACTLH